MISSMTSGATRDLAAAALSAAAVEPPGAGLKAGAPRALNAPISLAGTALAAAALTSAKKKTTTKTTRKRSTPGYASSAKKTSSSRSTPTKAGGALAFLDDPRLSTEEKLFRFMMYVTERYDRDIEQKMKEAGGSGTSATGGSTTTTKKKSSNPFSKIAGAIKTVFPAAGIALEALNNKNLQSILKSLSGPALAAGATALGMPALAPILAKVGPQLAGVSFDLAKALNEPAGATTPTSRTSSSSGSTSGTGDPEVDRRKVMELQYAMDKQKEMFSLVSNILRSMHDMKMVAVQNVRS